MNRCSGLGRAQGMAGKAQPCSPQGLCPNASPLKIPTSQRLNSRCPHLSRQTLSFRAYTRVPPPVLVHSTSTVPTRRHFTRLTEVSTNRADCSRTSLYTFKGDLHIIFNGQIFVSELRCQGRVVHVVHFRMTGSSPSISASATTSSYLPHPHAQHQVHQPIRVPRRASVRATQHLPVLLHPKVLYRRPSFLRLRPNRVSHTQMPITVHECAYTSDPLYPCSIYYVRRYPHLTYY